jgi:hypothetical protein
MTTLGRWAAVLAFACLPAPTVRAGEIPAAKPEAVGMSGAKLAKVTAVVQLQNAVKPLVYEAIVK